MDDSKVIPTPYPPPPLTNASSGGSFKPSNANHRGGRYKEKFQALREKYDQVTSTNKDYELALTRAEEKIKRLQEECNLLLDAVDIAVPAQPTLLHYLSRDPIDPAYYSFTVPVPPTNTEAPPAPIHQAGPPSRSPPPPEAPPSMAIQPRGPPPALFESAALSSPHPQPHPPPQSHPRLHDPQDQPRPPPHLTYAPSLQSLGPGIIEPTQHIMPITGFAIEQLGHETPPPSTGGRGRGRGQSGTPRRARGRGGRGRGRRGTPGSAANGHTNGENGVTR